MADLLGLRIGGALDNKAASGGAAAASQAEVDAGTVADEYISPLTLRNTPTGLLKVKNTSGFTAATGWMGYLVWTAASGMEFKSTVILATDYISACAVVTGGADGTDIWVSTRGRHPLLYTSTAPSAGDYLILSGIGAVVRQTFMSPDVVAVAQAAGAGSVVDALLLLRTVPVSIAASEVIVRTALINDTDFNGTIATLPGGAVLTYNVVSGDEGVLDAFSATTLAKLRLYNSTRATYALISDTVVGTNTITLTDTVPAGWATTDAITVRSQTNTNLVGASYYLDFEITSAEIPELTRVIDYELTFVDTGAAGERVIVHPWKAFSSAERRILDGVVANRNMYKYDDVPLYQRRFTVQATASGAATMLYILALRKAYVAAP